MPRHPPARDALDRSAEDKVREDCEDQRDDHGLAGIESAEHLPLVDRVHRKAEQDDARNRKQAFAQAIAALSAVVNDRR
jgi:hypothetical protein